MTVCVAAMAHYFGRTIVIGASDRMVTAGDIEFEQEQMKIYHFTSSITMMIAGDLAVQTGLLLEVEAWGAEAIRAKPEEWLQVKDVAEKFHGCLLRMRRGLACDAILTPLNLDYEKLVSDSVSSALGMQLAKEVLDFQIAPIEAIVMGVDPTGTHLYVVDNRGVTCQDWIGFAAIGGGAWHANSQLMYAEHVKSRNFDETLMLAYTAKRRADIAPGVGEATDMVVVGPGLGETIIVGKPLMDLLTETYTNVKHQAETVRRNANATISQFFQEASRETPVQPQTATTLEAGSSEGQAVLPEESDGG